MTIEVDGKTVETTPTGFLANQEDWSENVARVLAAQEELELTQKHWDLIHFLRDQYFNHAQNQPNTRNIVKAMAEVWSGESVDAKTLYGLFPKDPSKQAGRIAGLPESRRKGGY
jgi:tRNA 2-thiouridine synthesizing protein E